MTPITLLGGFYLAIERAIGDDYPLHELLALIERVGFIHGDYGLDGIAVVGIHYADGVTESESVLRSES